MNKQKQANKNKEKTNKQTEKKRHYYLLVILKLNIEHFLLSRLSWDA